MKVAKVSKPQLISTLKNIIRGEGDKGQEPTRVLALANAFFLGVLPVLAGGIGRDAALEKRTDPDSFCAACKVVLRDDGSAVIYDEKTKEIVGSVRATNPAGDDAISEKASVKRGPYNGGVTAAVHSSKLLNARSDGCNARKCSRKSECVDNGCDLGCQNGKCWGYIGVPGWCGRGCKINRRENGEAVVVRTDTGAVVGTVNFSRSLSGLDSLER
ncbi:hypothetical protein VTI74DRAFT_8290 [Chaetomium olivicolor]